MFVAAKYLLIVLGVIVVWFGFAYVAVSAFAREVE